MVSNEYELAQKRIQARTHKRNNTIVLVMFIVLAIIVCLLAGTSFFLDWLPLILSASLFAASNAVDLYYHSPAHQLSSEVVSQEMAWLFGDNWHELSGSEEYALAQDRVCERQIGRWRLFAHLLIYGLALGFVFLRVHPTGPISYILFGLWFLVLFYHFRYAFPSPDDLARRERKAGEAIRRELELLTPEKRKHEEKPKRAYALGDDGEIVELEEVEVVDELDRSERGGLV
jgi:hypothetical protein